MDLEQINSQLGESTPQEITAWALSLNKRTVISTNFGPQEAVLLHMATSLNPDITVLWADSGYALKKTYEISEKLTKLLNLNLQVFSPKISTARWDNVFGGVPSIDEEQKHKDFTQHFKLEPFSRGMKELNPEVWLTAVRKEQTEFRQSLDIVSQTAAGVIKVAPVLNWTEAEMKQYIKDHSLPDEKEYYDPTKVLANRECGLHLEG